jgi:hypothetical protein
MQIGLFESEAEPEIGLTLEYQWYYCDYKLYYYIGACVVSFRIVIDRPMA